MPVDARRLPEHPLLAPHDLAPSVAGWAVLGGAPPVRTERGWLAIYHGVDEAKCYRLGAVLLDPEEPWRVLSRSRDPILQPEARYEREGLMPNVVFTCGLARDGDRLRLCYDAADDVTCAADLSLDDLLASLEVRR